MHRLSRVSAAGLALGWVATVVGVGCDGDGLPPPEPATTGSGGAATSGGGGSGPTFTCAPGWSVDATVPRGQAPAEVTWVTTCEGLAAEDVDGLTIGEEGDYTIARRVIDGDDKIFVSVRGKDVFTADDAMGPVLPDVALTLLLDGAEVPLTAEGPRTHLGEGERSARYADKAAASTTQVPPHTTAALAVRNDALFGSRLGLAPSFLSTAYDDVAAELVLHTTPLGGAPATELGRIGATASEGAVLTGAGTADGGVQVFATALCTEDPACPVGIAFYRATFNEGGVFVELGDSGNAGVLLERPLDLAVPLDRGFHQSPVRGPAGLELRTLYPGLDGAAGEWVVVDAFADDPDGLTTVEPVGNLSTIAGVTPTMVENGDARIGLVRGVDANLDPTVAPAEGELFAWAARANANGPGTTFALARLEGAEAGGALQEKTFDNLEPGTASLHVVRWGSGQARVYAGLDARGDVVAWVGEVDPNSGVVGPTRSLAPPGTFRLVEPQTHKIEITDIVEINAFGMSIGINTTKTDTEVNVGALLDGPDQQTMVFDAGGSTATADPLVGIAVPRFLAEGAGTDAGVPTDGGHATVAPLDPTLFGLDPTTCGQGQQCATDLAQAPSGLRVSYQRLKDAVDDRGYFLHNGPGGEGQALFASAPTATILHNEPPVIIDLEDGAAEVVFPVLTGTGDDEGIGMLRLSVREGEDTAEDSIAVDFGDLVVVYRMLGGNRFGYAIHSVGAQPHLIALPREDGATAPRQTITAGLTDASGTFSSRPCPMVDPSCAITAQPALDATTSERLSLAGKTVTHTPAEGLDAAEPYPSLVRVAELGGGACPLQTVLHPSFGQESPPVVLSTSSREDCADVAVPIAAGDFLGRGSEQFLLMTADPTSVRSTLSLVWVELGEGRVAEVEVATVDAALDLSVAGAASAVVAVDVNEDRYPDLWLDPTGRGLQIAVGARGFYLGDGRGGFFETAVSIPGLDAMGPRGTTGRPGGIQAATSAFGFGTRSSAITAQSKTQLL